MRIRLLLAVWVPLVFGAVACRGCVLPDRNLGRRVERSEVVGTWRMTAASVALLERDGLARTPGAEFRVTFREDGTLDFSSAHEGASIRRASGEGRWELRHDTRSGAANELSVQLPPDGHHTTWGFDERDDRLVLWEFLGDPDSWEFTEYTQE